MFEDSFGNSVGNPFQQCNPPWTHAALKELCGSSGSSVFSNWIKKNFHGTKGAGCLGR